MTSDQITAIVSAWQANAISRDTMFDLFRTGEVLPAGRSNQEESQLLASVAKPTPPAAAAPSPAPTGGTQPQPTIPNTQ
jgi:hypothetical protein